ncbi:hypothetical protein PQX77_003210 [Marasmius sp. AFHP31]|nr:hypothetical protein PQX77_003215 [Marasmius sp. AFHP31]KAK1233624.1 hypothetical protein PQX77_003210 [Marasmius sp. AFHP31]
MLAPITDDSCPDDCPLGDLSDTSDRGSNEDDGGSSEDVDSDIDGSEMEVNDSDEDDGLGGILSHGATPLNLQTVLPSSLV